jgi:dihydroorotase
VHFRDNLALHDTVFATARHFSRALVMPNLQPALTTLQSLLDYRERILNALANRAAFTPFMTFYLNEKVNPKDLEDSSAYPFILGAKLYPAGATTHSEEGVTSLHALYPLFDLMQQQGLVLQIHGELNEGDIFHREAAFIEQGLVPLVTNFPRLRIVLEHISTQAAVDFVTQAPPQVAATLTPHHLLYNRNDLLAGGLKPHLYCLPILKKASCQRALVQAATSGNPKFFAGTDSAPHPVTQKESACGCAGIYSAPYALALYAECFAKANQLDKLNPFLAHFGADFYHLPPNRETLQLQQVTQKIPPTLPLGEETVIPIAAGLPIEWSVHENA